MSTKELYLKINNILLKLTEINGYSISITYNGNPICSKYVSYYIHYYKEIIKYDALTYNTKNLKNKLKELETFVDERVNNK